MLIDDSFIYELDSTCRGKIARIIKDPDVLNCLAEDEDEWVRWDVASNPNTPPETLDRLAKDKIVFVKHVAINNPNYKNEPSNIQVTNEQMVALKTLIESASDPHLQEMLQHIVK